MARIMEFAGGRGSAWRLGAWAAVVALILLVPACAMLVTDEVNWTAFDFIFAFTLLFGAGAVFELALRTTRNLAYRAGVGVAIVTALLLVWVTGAVGIIGSEDDAANLMYGAVLAVAVAGSLAARLRPDGMALAMLAAAALQVLVAAIALIAGFGSATSPDWPRDIIGATAMFVVLWLVSASLLRKAGRERPETRAVPVP